MKIWDLCSSPVTGSWVENRPVSGRPVWFSVSGVHARVQTDLSPSPPLSFRRSRSSSVCDVPVGSGVSSGIRSSPGRTVRVQTGLVSFPVPVGSSPSIVSGHRREAFRGWFRTDRGVTRVWTRQSRGTGGSWTFPETYGVGWGWV